MALGSLLYPPQIITTDDATSQQVIRSHVAHLRRPHGQRPEIWDKPTWDLVQRLILARAWG